MPATPPRLRYACTFPSTPAATYAVVAPVPLTEVLGSRHLAIPGVVRVDQHGPWPGEVVGHERTLHFSDGGSAVEELTAVDPPHLFAYPLRDVTGPMRLLFRSVDGTWAFEPSGTGCRVTWTWELDARPAGRAIMPAFRPMWTGMASRCFDRLVARSA